LLKGEKISEKQLTNIGNQDIIVALANTIFMCTEIVCFSYLMSLVSDSNIQIKKNISAIAEINVNYYFTVEYLFNL